MPVKNTPSEPVVDALLLAQKCRAVARQRFTKTSCIETSLVFERAAAHLGLSARRIVCQVAAYSPKLAAQMKAGTVDRSKMDEPGIWSVGIGIPESPDDYLGRLDTLNNRFVGHVVCIIEDHLVDPTADQMSRPDRDMPMPEPVLCRMDDAMRANQVAWTETPHGVLLKYLLYPDVTVPPTKWGKVIERMALQVVRELGVRP